jgi:hypothetical protein
LTRTKNPDIFWAQSPLPGMSRKEILSLDADEGTTPTQPWVKEMRRNDSFLRNRENNGDSPHLRGKIDG